MPKKLWPWSQKENLFLGPDCESGGLGVVAMPGTQCGDIVFRMAKNTCTWYVHMWINSINEVVQY